MLISFISFLAFIILWKWIINLPLANGSISGGGWWPSTIFPAVTWTFDCQLGKDDLADNYDRWRPNYLSHCRKKAPASQNKHILDHTSLQDSKPTCTLCCSPPDQYYPYQKHEIHCHNVTGLFILKMTMTSDLALTHSDISPGRSTPSRNTVVSHCSETQICSLHLHQHYFPGSSLLLFRHKSGDSIREQTTCTVRPANASSYLCLICVLVLPNLLSLSVPLNNWKKTNATNRTIKKDYPPPRIPSFYSTSNVSLVCCQRYIEANWH